MKYLGMLVLLMTGCSQTLSGSFNPDNLKFHVGQKVKVKNGFYRTCEGVIENYSPIFYYSSEGKPPEVVYTVGLDCDHIDHFIYEHFKESRITGLGE